MAKISTCKMTIWLMTLALTACAVPPQNSQRSDDPCDSARSAAAGAVLGALAGVWAGGRDSAVKGAAIGAIAGVVICSQLTLQSKQTKSAAQVDAEQRVRLPALPTTPTLITYSPRLLDTSIVRGQAARLASTIELANGSRETVQEVVEEVVIVDPSGARFRSGTKSFSAASAGRFENSFEIVLPQQAPTGRYTVATNVYLNGRLTASRSVYLTAV